MLERKSIDTMRVGANNYSPLHLPYHEKGNCGKWYPQYGIPTPWELFRRDEELCENAGRLRLLFLCS